MTINIDFYNKNTKDLTNQYNSLSFENVHKGIIKLLPEKGNILDIGCGSGRDAFALANLGYNVTAVDPAINMLISANENFKHDNIQWINDKMPTLDKVKSLNKKFDFILLSAVWMHIEPEDRKESFENLQSLLKKDAQMIISLRHGDFSDERKANPVSQFEIESFSDGLNIQSESLLKNDKDALNRDEVSWQIMRFQNTPKIKPKRKIKP
jgi:2-polyprenyl-3-methyl-5-hydroxy-6-metoxy-1,4-benzoquinol methylase